MDYNEMVFAYHVRELAFKRLMSDADKRKVESDELLKSPGFEHYVKDVVHELEDIAAMIKRSYSRSSSIPARPPAAD